MSAPRRAKPGPVPEQTCACRWNTPIDAAAAASKNKRKAEDDDIDEDVRKRLDALKEAGGAGPD